MNRTTSKHSPRRDEQLEHEEQGLLRGSPDEGRTEPRRGEAPGLDEGGLGTRPEVEETDHAAPTQSEIETRAALAACFPATTFPARRDQLIEEARARYADALLIGQLEGIPDRLYETVGEVWTAIAAAPDG